MTLPTPDSAFHWTAETWGHALRCRPLTAIAQHAFTSRQLQLRGSPDEQPIGWTQATATVGCGIEQLMRVKQVHGARVRVLKKGQTGPHDVLERPEGDAIVANAPGLVLSVQVADCVPILIADSRNDAVAAVHAGWRGTCAGVARATVDAMVREFGTDPADLVAAIGPSIGRCCYTVGLNVVDAFRKSGASDVELGNWFLETGEGSRRLDLWAANHAHLVNSGMQRDRIHVCGLCTQTHHGIFESYRVDGERAGRMAALIAVP